MYLGRNYLIVLLGGWQLPQTTSCGYPYIRLLSILHFHLVQNREASPAVVWQGQTQNLLAVKVLTSAQPCCRSILQVFTFTLLYVSVPNNMYDFPFSKICILGTVSQHPANTDSSYCFLFSFVLLCRHSSNMAPP